MNDDEYGKAMLKLSDEALKEQDNEYIEKIRGQLRCNRLGADQWVDSDIWKLIGIIGRIEERNKSLEKQLANSIPIVRSCKGEPTHVDEIDWMEP